MLQKSLLALALPLIIGTLPAASHAAGKLNVLCSSEQDWCDQMRDQFQRESGIEVAMTRKSGGDVHAQLKAEAGKPTIDVWWGGTGDLHLAAANEGLTETYKSPVLDQLRPWAVKQAEAAKHRSVGIYMGLLGFGYNRDALAKKNLPEPKCWKDLLNPVYKGHILISNPKSSGTAYTVLATLVQLMGEKEAFAYAKKLDANVAQYTASGSAPARSLSKGEATIAIGFQHDILKESAQGTAVGIESPCEGTGYEIGSMSIVKGARNMESAKRFYEFALAPEVQTQAQVAKAFQVPSHTKARMAPRAPRIEKVTAIDYDIEKYGNPDTRKRLVKRWEDEVPSPGR
jgi:iron(III) transport system substrate-binding protein